VRRLRLRINAKALVLSCVTPLRSSFPCTPLNDAEPPEPERSPAKRSGGVGGGAACRLLAPAASILFRLAGPHQRVVPRGIGSCDGAELDLHLRSQANFAVTED
jgi:hypothetical protein